MTTHSTAGSVGHSPNWPAGARSRTGRGRAPRQPRCARSCLFWLIYDGGRRCQEALAINLEDIDWAERSIRIHGKGDRAREMFFSWRVSRYLDDYLKQRGEPTLGPLFITA
jgi:site-specific recombinase XerD